MRAGEASLGMDTGRGGDEAGTLHLLRSRHYGLLSGASDEALLTVL